MADPAIHRATIAVLLLVMIVVPGGWLAASPLGLAYVAWYWRQQYRLPFRLPMHWGGRDPSNPEPGSRRRWRRSLGMLFLGNDAESGEELWLSDSDARRHALILGTTGAGKALPDDTPILTPSGWRRNGDLQVGDQVITPHGRAARILSIHPQGPLPVVRLVLADGRVADCSPDHLWRVAIRSEGRATLSDDDGTWRLRRAADIGLQFHLRMSGIDGQPLIRLFLPLPRPAQGALPGCRLDTASLHRAAEDGLGQLSFMPSLAGSPRERLDWTSRLLHLRQPTSWQRGLDIPARDDADGFRLRHLVWSLGGTAIQIATDDRLIIRTAFPAQHRLLPGLAPDSDEWLRRGIEIVDVEGGSGPDHGERRTMRCIRIDDPDGLFVMDGYLVTHNTELLLGMAAQSLMWASGFLFVDGKGTTEFHGRAWSLATRFGRQADYRILNFTDPGRGRRQSNTTNPFARGSADQLLNLIVSLMSDAGRNDDMWRSRAMSLVAATVRALCEMRDAGDIHLDVQTIRDHLQLGRGPDRGLLGGRKITNVEAIPRRCWDEMARRGGMIELYLRALRGEFSDASRLSLSSFFGSLPGFSLERALNGQPQEGRAAEQHGFLAMQLTRPLGALADDFGHIFRAPVGEVDMDDVVLNRRILVVLLPALQKAPDEMRNCGKIIVAMLKMMMGRAAGSAVEGSRQRLVESRPTRAPSPFIVILDEAGYYMVKGIDTMMAQARSLGFMMIIAGQDMASMQSVLPHVAETVAANARLTAAGALEDAHRTWGFLRRKFATRSLPDGTTSGEPLPSRDVSFTQQPRVRIDDLQSLREGEFYFLMESTLVRAHAFHTGECWSDQIGLNRLIVIRGPRDRFPGEPPPADARKALKRVRTALSQPTQLADIIARHATPRPDALATALDHAQAIIAATPPHQRNLQLVRTAYRRGLLSLAPPKAEHGPTLNQDNRGTRRTE